MVEFSPVWIGFFVIITILLLLDLGVFNREAHIISTKEALGWTTVWIAVALIFNIGVYFIYENGLFNIQRSIHPDGKEAALAFLTAYLVEKSLSLDNIFVIAMIFNYFKVPSKYQHRVLFYGITGAIVMRAILIFIGVNLINQFAWLIYFFGAILILTGIRMLVMRHDDLNPDDNVLIKLIRKYIPITDEYHDEKFFVNINNIRHATPLLLALTLVEFTDLMFAVDSIPAIFAISLDPFIILTSNVFAILGLRSLYFALAGLMEKFRYVKTSLVFVMVFVGVKMLLLHHYKIPITVSLVVISTILGVGVISSIISAGKDTVPIKSPLNESKPNN